MNDKHVRYSDNTRPLKIYKAKNVGLNCGYGKEKKCVCVCVCARACMRACMQAKLYAKLVWIDCPIL